MQRILALLLALLIWAPAQGAFGKDKTPNSAEEIHLSFAPLVKRTSPAVVNIYTSKTVQDRGVNPLFNDPFFRRFFGNNFPGGSRERVQNSLGSGVIVASNGLIVTNFHVVDGADEIRVVLPDRREYLAKVVTLEEHNDLALLKVDPEGARLPALRFGDSDDIEVGDLVLAIGNPFGVGQTVTSGIISASARSSSRIGEGGVFIQTDAAINPGNSGGALVDIEGELVGVNTAIFSRSGGSHGIGFAIPSNLVKLMVQAYQSGGKVVRPWLGGSGQAVGQDVAQAMGMARPQGVILSNVNPKGPLARAGLRANDVILSVGDQQVDDPVALRYRFETVPGRSASIQYWRRGQVYTANVVIEPPPEDPPRHETVLDGDTPFGGLRVVNVSPAVNAEMNLGDVEDGVVVNGLRRNSIASRVGFRSGDVIESVNGKSIGTVDDLNRVNDSKPSRWQIILRRDGKRLRMDFRA
jgi:Do/DeqQ family serine protease